MDLMPSTFILLAENNQQKTIAVLLLLIILLFYQVIECKHGRDYAIVHDKYSLIFLFVLLITVNFLGGPHPFG